MRLIPFLILITLTLAGTPQQTTAAEPTQKLKIITTLFPQYDFTKHIAGTLADIHLLLPPGSESHSFEPTPGDMRNIASADIFIYTGNHMEPWAKRLADATTTQNTLIVDASQNIKHQTPDNTTSPHTHTSPHKHDDPHSHSADPHIWLDPTRAITMVENIAAALAARDPDSSPTYRKNADTLITQLTQLDTWFKNIVDSSPRRLLVFGERFAFSYFFQHYGLEAAGAYKNCAPGAEPGLKAVIDVVNTIKENNVRFVYLEDMSTGRISELLHKETGAEILRVDSLHNPSATRQNAGESYISIMKENMNAFAKGLQ